MAAARQPREYYSPGGMNADRRTPNCSNINSMLERAYLRLDKADMAGMDTRRLASEVRGLRKFKQMCDSNRTPELRFDGFGTFNLRGTGSFGGMYRR